MAISAPHIENSYICFPSVENPWSDGKYCDIQKALIV